MNFKKNILIFLALAISGSLNAGISDILRYASRKDVLVKVIGISGAALFIYKVLKNSSDKKNNDNLEKQRQEILSSKQAEQKAFADLETRNKVRSYVERLEISFGIAPNVDQSRNDWENLVARLEFVEKYIGQYFKPV